MKKIIFILVLFAFTTFSVDLLSYPWGISGRTKKTYSSGCSTCHYFGPAYVNAVFNSPDTVVMGQTYLFSITITKSNTGNGGIDIAAKSGTLDTMGSPYLKLSAGELIHKDRISIPSGTITITPMPLMSGGRQCNNYPGCMFC